MSVMTYLPISCTGGPLSGMLPPALTCRHPASVSQCIGGSSSSVRVILFQPVLWMEVSATGGEVQL